MTRFHTWLAPTLLLLVACAGPGARRTPTLAAGPDGAARGGHTLHAMVGATAGRRDDGATFAATWEYRATEQVGLGAFGDVVLGSPTTTLVGGAGYFHLTPQLTVVAGPGVEFHDGHAHLFGRVGGFYDFPMGEWKMGPAVFFDLGLGDVAASVALAFGFDF